MKKGLYLLGLCTLISCADLANCDTDRSREFLVLRFFNLETKAAREIGFLITAEGSTDTFKPSDDSTAIELPLNTVDTVSTFFFSSDTSSFELTVRHDLSLAFFDEDCDPSISFFNLDTLSHSFDSLAIINTITNTQVDTNVEVYF